MKWFGREPVFYLAFFAIVLKLAAGFGLDVSADQQTVINAALAAVVGVISAFVLHTGAVAAAVLQFAQAAMALFIGFGLNFSADNQALIMSAVAAGLALFLHGQVVAPVAQVPVEQSSPLDKTGDRR
jgi:low affinity Fe/Cu permease